MKTVTIIGFGRFGKTLYRLLKGDFKITVYNRTPINNSDGFLDADVAIAKDLESAYKSEVIIYSVAISAFEPVIAAHQKYFRQDHLLIDVLSVKVHAKNVFEKYLTNSKIQALLTHPMFGPDSSKDGFEDLPMILDGSMCSEKNYLFWKNYFESKKLKVIELSASEHDKLAANSQGVAHFIGRLLELIDYKQTPIDSLGAKRLMQIKEQVCNDTWQLFHDLQTYNPYTKDMRRNLGEAYNQLYNKLLPERASPDYFLYGIQGGVGSFNEQALLYFLKKHNIRDYKISFLYTTEKVLKHLHEGDVDFGLFAITNSTGGLVEETMHALTKYQCNIVEDFEILISHSLMKRKHVSLRKIDTIMAHPQVLKQCEKNLLMNYKDYKTQSGTGDLVDTAKAAECLAKGELPSNIAILGPKNLAERYDFDIIAENLQDKKDNSTRFLLVKR